MSILGAMAAQLKDTAAVSAIVGTRVGKRLAGSTWPLPYIILHQIGGNHVRHMTGGSGLAWARVQMNCYDVGPTKAETLGNETRLALDNFRGTMGTGGDTREVRSCSLGEEEDDLEVGRPGESKRAYAWRQRWVVWFNESKT